MSNQSAAHALARRHLSRELKRLMVQQRLTPYTLMFKTTQLAIDGRIKMGVHDASIYQYLAGKALPTRDRLESLAAALEVPATDLVPDIEEIPVGKLKRRTGVLPKARVELQRGVDGLDTARVYVQIRHDMPALKADKVVAAFKQLCQAAEIELTEE